MVCRVAKPGALLGIAAGLLICSSAAALQSQNNRVTLQWADLARAAREFSAECKVAKAYGPVAPLSSFRRAIKERRFVKVLAIGSSSTVGVGASSPASTYPVRLENNLEALVPGLDVRMMNRGVSGETGQDAVQRLKQLVAEHRPDLVIWQVGTNDALARIDEDDFADMLRETLDWLHANGIDVILIDPQYVKRLSDDPHYTNIVNTISKVATQERILVVNRFGAMADLAKRNGETAYLAPDKFHLNDLGYRCMAEYAARAIAAGILQAETEAAQKQSAGP